ncbi:MAG: exo-alpha-sialidase [Euryarchaeota archaeon]|nr:exo-alpha-sialidase [Euryarchaeota archaeon]
MRPWGPTWRVLGLAFLLGVSGCISSGPPTGPDDDGPLGAVGSGTGPDGSSAPAAGATCDPQFNSTAGGVCALFLDPTGASHADREASLATHPRNPGTVLVTWRVGEFDVPRIFAALTSDAGANWAISELRDPALDSNPLTKGRYNFDSIAGFGPDGIAYVMYGEVAREPETRTRVSDGLTLASTKDGVKWDFKRFADGPAGVSAPDFMDMAIAPDTGMIYVVSQNYVFAPLFVAPVCSVAPCFVQQGIWFLKSSDGGTTWSEMELVMRTVQPLAGHYAPRVAAGPGGFVMVTSRDFDNAAGSFGVGAVISRDGGETFEGPLHPYEQTPGDMMVADPTALWTDASGMAQVALMISGERGIVRVLSADQGKTWGEPVRLDGLPQGEETGYGVAAARTDGTLYALQRFGNDSHYGAMLYVSPPGGEWRTVLLADAGVDGTYKVGDDYAGLSVAADGHVWAAWSDLSTKPPRIAVVRA